MGTGHSEYTNVFMAFFSKVRLAQLACNSNALCLHSLQGSPAGIFGPNRIVVKLIR
jgi:hypothetical protein